MVLWPQHRVNRRPVQAGCDQQKGEPMSAGGEGVVLALPVAVIGLSAAALAAVAVGVAGAGVIVVREGGRLVLACGHELRAVAGEQLAMQRALRAAARSYEGRLLGERLDQQRDAAASAAARLAAARALHARVNQELASLRAASQADSVAAVDQLRLLREQVLAAGPPLSLQSPDLSGRLAAWASRLRQARALSDQIGLGLERYHTGARSRLFVVDGLLATLADARSRLATLDDDASQVLAGATLPDTDQLDSALGDLDYIDRRLIELDAQTPQQIRRRRDALDALALAAVALERAVASPALAEHPALDLAADTLNDASRALDRCEFERAAQLATAATAQVSSQDTAVAAQRQRNVALFLELLEQRVTGLGELPELQAEARAWRERCTQCKTTAASDPAAAWTQAEALANEAETLQQRALGLLTTAAGRTMSDLTREALVEMGFAAEVRDLAEGRREVVATQSGRQVGVVLSTSGEMTMRFEGFGDTSCQTVQHELIDRLRAKGVVGAWKERFSLSRAVQQTVSLLNRQGLDVRVEPSQGGVTVVASGRVNARSTISYDGTIRADEAWTAAVRSGQLGDLSTDLAGQAERRAQEEFIRRQREHQRWLQTATIRVGEAG